MFRRYDTRACVTTIMMAACVCCIAIDARSDVIPRLNRGESLTITAIGTSLTDASSSTWFGHVGAWLNDRYPGKVTLHDEGVGSSASKYTPTYTTPESGLDVQLPKALAHSPDVIFIEFAMNDAYTPYGILQQASRNNLKAMIDQVRSWGAEHDKTVDIIVQTMNNVLPGSTHDAKRPTLATYYQGYRDIAAANDVLLIDHAPNWLQLYNSQSNHATWNSYMPDGIHPNDLGAVNVIVPEIQRMFNAQVPEPTSHILLGTWLTVTMVYFWRKRRGYREWQAFPTPPLHPRRGG